MDDAVPRPAKQQQTTKRNTLWWWCCCCCSGFGSDDGSAVEKSLLRRPSWLQRSTPPMDSQDDLNWWRKGWNSVRTATEWSESAMEDAAGCCRASKLRNFVGRFRAKRPVRFQYDPLSYALNFDQGSALEADYPHQDFSARFVAPIRTERGKGGAL